jgi:hypothetical protein
MQDMVGCDYNRTPVIFQGFDNCRIVGHILILTPSISGGAVPSVCMLLLDVPRFTTIMQPLSRRDNGRLGPTDLHHSARTRERAPPNRWKRTQSPAGAWR